MFNKDLAQKGFFAGLITYMHSGPVCAMVWEGKSVVKAGRTLLGAIQPCNINQVLYFSNGLFGIAWSSIQKNASDPMINCKKCKWTGRLTSSYRHNKKFHPEVIVRKP
jgi:hypothetical protein